MSATAVPRSAGAGADEDRASIARQSAAGKGAVILRFLRARPRLALAAMFLLGFGLAILGTVANHFPTPRGHDEMSYLLGADTFAHWRLTNPTHPMWKYFETFHVLQRPSYMSKYPPAQALVLAFGQVTTGSPRVGVWLAFGAMAAALLWMLLVWTDKRYAVAVAIAFTICLAPTYWASSYWGGALATTGGALVYGAARRVTAGDSRLITLAVVLAVGLMILANSRPYEGVLACLPIAMLLVWWLIRYPGPTRHAKLTRFVAPFALVLATGAGFMLLYNHEVTGSWLTLPYVAYQRQYDPMPVFNFLKPHAHFSPPNDAFRSYLEWEHRLAWPFTLAGYTGRLGYISAKAGLFFLPHMALWFVFAALPLALRSSHTRVLAVAAVITFLGMALTRWFDRHYVGPIFAACIGIWAECLRCLDVLRIRSVPAGRWVGALAIVLLAGMGVNRFGDRYFAEGVGRRAEDWGMRRQDIAARLQAMGGKHLVLVNYAPEHVVHYDWVYNPANVDTSPVLWARDFGTAGNRPLLRYFRGRRIWRMTMATDSTGIRLEPVSP